MMNNCERCCYFEFCTSKGRTETKDCVYGRKGEEEGDDGTEHDNATRD